MMLLEVENLSVEYYRRRQILPALRNVSLNLDRGETLGIVGESGCGKSTLALSVLRLISPHEGRIPSGKITFDGADLLTLREEGIRSIRGKEISIIFQDPFSSMNPVLKIGDQVSEAILAHESVPIRRSSLFPKVLELLKKVRLDDPERIFNSYPHQVSGGQRQRVMIASAIANSPKLLIADEPTTALDVTIQKEILELLDSLRRELNMAILLITHHIGIIARYTDKIVVLYAGEVMEEGKTEEVIKNPQHPYTQSLLRSLPEKKKKDRLFVIPGSPPDPSRLPQGCIFHPRCFAAVEDCRVRKPVLRNLENSDKKVSCHLAPFENNGEFKKGNSETSPPLQKGD